MVHDACRSALDALRPHYIDPSSAQALQRAAVIVKSETRLVNVAQVRQLSPFRYPGGKTWLVPEVKTWLRSLPRRPSIFLEPFAGGAIVGLTVAAESMAGKVILCELDDSVAAVWKTLIHGTDTDANWLCDRILKFEVTEDNVRSLLEKKVKSDRERAFQTIVRNRMQRGGILAPGASLMKSGENGRGLGSRWYPETLVSRIKAIRNIRHRIEFRHQDAFDLIKEYTAKNDVAWFVDPPYTAGGKRAGARLYTHTQIDHDRLFREMSCTKGDVLMTYDDAPEVAHLAERYGMGIRKVPMKSTHHAIMYELLLSK